MLTAVIRSDGSQQALAATLAVLIPAVAEGFLGHAVLVDTVGSPETERAPMRFMAMFRAPWASGLRAPRLMPGVTKRLRISLTLSTSSVEIGLRSERQSRRSRSWIGFCVRRPLDQRR